MTYVKLIRRRRPQFFSSFFEISKNHLSQLFLVFIFFFLNNYCLLILLLLLDTYLVNNMAISDSILMLFIFSFFLPILLGFNALEFMELLNVIRSVRIILIAQKIELRIVCFYLHDELLKWWTIFSNIAWSLVNHSLNLRWRNYNLRLFMSLLSITLLSIIFVVCRRHFNYNIIL